MRSAALFRISAKALAVLALPALMQAPQVDAFLSATMLRKLVAEQLVLVGCGCSAAWAFPPPGGRTFAPAGVAAATFVILFWMVPRSVDMTQIHPAARALYAASLFVAGYLYFVCLPRLPGVAVAAYGLYLSSMVVAVGVLYASQSTLWCSAYTLDIQHAFGRAFAGLGLAGYAVTLALIPRWLVPKAGTVAGGGAP